MSQEFTHEDIYPFFKTFDVFSEKNEVKSKLSLKLGYDYLNIHKKMKGEAGRPLSEIEKEGIIMFYFRDYPERVQEYLKNKANV